MPDAGEDHGDVLFHQRLTRLQIADDLLLLLVRQLRVSHCALRRSMPCLPAPVPAFHRM